MTDRAEYQRQYYLANRARLLEAQALRVGEDPSLQRRREQASRSKRMAADVAFRAFETTRRRLNKALKGELKVARTVDLLGCTTEQLRAHLEVQFRPGMTWSNYGAWHIDHIRPCASFDLSDPEQQRQCFHFTNLQPLWARDNLKKSATWAS
jgi:hypothetical protein